MYNPGDSISLSDNDLSFVGVYEVNQYDVSFINKDNEALFETLSLDYGSEYTLPNPEQIKGYTFVGWLSEDIIYSANTKVTLSDSNRVYTAVYEKVKPNDSSNQVHKESSSKVVDTGISDISGLLVIVIFVSVLSIVLLISFKYSLIKEKKSKKIVLKKHYLI